jgi:hypothetical protein
MPTSGASELCLPVSSDSQARATKQHSLHKVSKLVVLSMRLGSKPQQSENQPPEIDHPSSVPSIAQVLYLDIYQFLFFYFFIC